MTEYAWQHLVESGKYRPKYPDSPFVHVADLVNPETGKTQREENAELKHVIPIGSLVEIKETGARLFVVHYGRDCDQTPLYWLAADPDDNEQRMQGFGNYKWHGGYSDACLVVISLPAAEPRLVAMEEG
jgi:hypothetical protein